MSHNLSRNMSGSKPRRFTGRVAPAVTALVLAALGLGSAFTATSVTRTVGVTPNRAAAADVRVGVDNSAAENRELQLLAARVSRATRTGISAAGAPPAAPATGLAAPSAPATKKPAAKKPAAKKPDTKSRAAVGAPRREAAPVPAASGRVEVVIAFALAQVGKPYVFGATGPGAYDCSGLVMKAFARAGIALPRTADAIGARGVRVARANWRRGDILYWGGHVAIYLGNGQIVHASRAGVPVKVAKVYGSPVGRRVL